ncbi:hypothetical protein AKJ49_01070, partial [candidate division MSBL1 archaeon SCGC-AAA382A03]
MFGTKMIEKETIRETLSEYDKENITLGILCSHSALQLIHGAKLEGFNTIGICPEEREKAYKAFPKARADEYMIVDQFDEILEDDRQEEKDSEDSQDDSEKFEDTSEEDADTEERR